MWPSSERKVSPGSVWTWTGTRDPLSGEITSMTAAFSPENTETATARAPAPATTCNNADSWHVRRTCSTASGGRSQWTGPTGSP